MTKDDIISMATEAGLCYTSNGFIDWIDAGPSLHEMTLFAQLIAEAEKERIAKKIEQLPFGDTAQSFAIWVRNDT